MKRAIITLPVVAGLCLGLSACGGSSADDPEQFQSNLDKAIKAAEEGQALKKPAGRERK